MPNIKGRWIPPSKEEMRQILNPELHWVKYVNSHLPGSSAAPWHTAFIFGLDHQADLPHG